MDFDVSFTPRAQADLDRIATRLLKEAPLAGALWVERLEAAIGSLARNPDRCAVEPAAKLFTACPVLPV